MEDMSIDMSFKIYFLDSYSNEIGVRRFSLPASDSANYSFVTEKLAEMYPGLKETPYKIYWIDEENDNILVSSKQDWNTALDNLKSCNLKKFYIKILSETKNSENTEKKKSAEAHPHIFCNVCGNNIVGFRYKCIVCRDYDLCISCEQMLLHSEHPMLRIPNPFLFDRGDLRQLIHAITSFMSFKIENHQRKKHYHENSSEHSKKKRSHKYEYGTDEDLEEGCHKAGGKKSKKMGRCTYAQMFNDFLSNFDPFNLGDENLKPEFSKSDSKKNGIPKEMLNNVAYLNSIGRTIASYLDPLGVDVDFEIRPRETKKSEDTQPKPTTSSPKNSSTPQEKEVRFATPDQNKDSMNEKVEDITRNLANQKIKESPEKDDWISFEELQRYAREESPKESPKASQPQENAQKSSAPPQESHPLYPTLQPAENPHNPIIREALGKMLAMGFTNEGGWLTHLLEAKGGDINQALEVLAPHKKN